MTSEQMNIFCSKTNDILNKPATINDYTYASNGIMLIKCKTKEIYVNKGFPKVCEELLKQTKSLSDHVSFFNLPPQVVNEKEFKKCKHCNSKGTCCPDCENTGIVTYVTNNGYEYENDCDMCMDNHEICEECNGTGKIEIEPTITVGDLIFDKNTFDLLYKLKNVKLYLLYQQQPSYFTFEGGEGIIMPQLSTS